MNGYVCFFNGRKVEVYAASSYEAQKKAAQELKVKPNKQYQITVCLAEREGQSVSMAPSQLPGA